MSKFSDAFVKEVCSKFLHFETYAVIRKSNFRKDPAAHWVTARLLSRNAASRWPWTQLSISKDLRLHATNLSPTDSWFFSVRNVTLAHQTRWLHLKHVKLKQTA